MVEKPKGGDTDCLGRTFSDICGWLPAEAEIPVGTKVRLNAGRHPLDKYYAGREAVVLGSFTEGKGVWKTRMLALRLVHPEHEREVYQSRLVRKPEHVQVLSIGDGTILPGADYELTRKEKLDSLFAQADFTFEGYSNMPTFVAAIYLRQEAKHQLSVARMVRQDGSINPSRLRDYFYKHVDGARMQDVAWWPDGFPEWSDYQFKVNWQEIADEFATSFKEQAEYEQRKAA